MRSLIWHTSMALLYGILYGTTIWHTMWHYYMAYYMGLIYGILCGTTIWHTIWHYYMAQLYGTNIWQKYMDNIWKNKTIYGKIYGKNIWKKYMEKLKYMEKNIWKKYMEKIYGKNSICQHIEFFRTKGFWIVTRKTKRFYMEKNKKKTKKTKKIYILYSRGSSTDKLYGNIIWKHYMRKLYEKIIWENYMENISKYPKYQHIWYSYLRFWQKVLGSADTNLRSWGTVYKMLKMHSDWL